MLLDIRLLDDATRPRAPKLEGVTPAQRAAGEHLRMVHDHFRDNMRTLRQLIREAGAGEVTAEDLQQAAASMPMLENYRRFGTLCGEHCQILNIHHSIEDHSIFPALRQQSEAYRQVTDRLEAEHVVVHELLERLVREIETLRTDPSAANFMACRDIYETLERVLLSHFGYEEEEIGDALGYFQLLG